MTFKVHGHGFAVGAWRHAHVNGMSGKINPGIDGPGSRIFHRLHNDIKTEDGTCSEFAVYADVTSHQANDVAGNGKAKTSPASCLRLCHGRLHEASEDGLQLFRRDAVTRIPHLENDLASSPVPGLTVTSTPPCVVNLIALPTTLSST
jgi:hypothetical protein